MYTHSTFYHHNIQRPNRVGDQQNLTNHYMFFPTRKTPLPAAYNALKFHVIDNLACLVHSCAPGCSERKSVKPRLGFASPSCHFCRPDTTGGLDQNPHATVLSIQFFGCQKKAISLWQGMPKNAEEKCTEMK